MRLVEKHRPNSFDNVVNQVHIKTKLKNILSRPDDVPHMLFVGPPGTGKTSVAMCFAQALLGENWKSLFVEMNASDDRKIEHVRGRIKQYASLAGKRIIYLGESDNMTKDAQQALRRIFEKTRQTIFILSGNYEWKYIPAILSRCVIFRFQKIDDKSILKRLIEICQLEEVKVDFSKIEVRKGFEQLVKDSNGDIRSAINNLEKLINQQKEITEVSVVSLREPSMLKTAIQYAIQGDFEKAKQIVEDEYIMRNFDSPKIFNELYNSLDEIKDREVRIRLYAKLGELERNVKIGTTPLIQFVAFIAHCWIAPHLPKGCPALVSK